MHDELRTRLRSGVDYTNENRHIGNTPTYKVAHENTHKTYVVGIWIRGCL